MAASEFVPLDFVVPTEHRARNFLLRPLRASHLDVDFEALRIAGARLRSVFAANDSWPRDGITLDEDLEDLRRHEAEWERRLAFAYTVLSADESRCLGCVYLNPATKLGHDCECLLWTTDATQDSDRTRHAGATDGLGDPRDRASRGYGPRDEAEIRRQNRKSHR